MRAFDSSELSNIAGCIQQAYLLNYLLTNLISFGAPVKLDVTEKNDRDP